MPSWAEVSCYMEWIVRAHMDEYFQALHGPKRIIIFLTTLILVQAISRTRKTSIDCVVLQWLVIFQPEFTVGDE